MSKDRYESAPPRRRRRRRRRQRDAEGFDAGQFVDSLERKLDRAVDSAVDAVDAAVSSLRPGGRDDGSFEVESADARTLREARQRADEKVDFYRDCVKYGLIVVPLLIFIPPLGFIGLMLAGLKLGRRYYSLHVEPQLRERLVQEEVRKHVQENVTRERQELEGEHARSLEHLSASIAHEIRNPITAAKSLVQQMGEDPVAKDNVEYASVALEELERVEKSISHLLRFARDEELRLSPVRMSEILDSALETFRDRAQRTGVRLERQFDCEASLVGDPEKLRRVAINLVGNAIDALEEAGVAEPVIEISLGENLAGTEVWMRVRDNGPGVDEAQRERIWSPFQTSKETGTGLGLPIVRKVVEAHDGTIELESDPSGGAAFLVTFPKERRPAGGGS
ncbi:MAG: HAMP domain-containing histidine kinase [Proteobacteria bacterium]|nr:HAMP domain-containing histidine kinase [Pseudomonadota bacterium]